MMEAPPLLKETESGTLLCTEPFSGMNYRMTSLVDTHDTDPPKMQWCISQR